MSTAEEAEAMWFAAQRETYDNENEEDEDEELLRGVPCADDVVPMPGSPAMQQQPQLMDVVKETTGMRDDLSCVELSLQAAATTTTTTTTEVASGICEYPPLSRVSFMMRGDNGVVRWVTASGLKVETASRKRGREGSGEKEEEEEDEEEWVRDVRDLRRRHGSSGLGHVNIPALLQGLYDEAANDDERRVVLPTTSTPFPPEQQGTKRRGRDEETLWVMKYSPKHFRELLSDDNTNLKLLQWLKSWDAYIFQDTSATRNTGNNNNNNVNAIATNNGTAAAAAATDGASAPTRPEERLAVLVGPPGVGKTTLAHVLAAHCGYETVEINASVDRTSSAMERAIQLAVSPARGRRRALPLSSLSTSSSNVDGASKATSKTGEAGVSLVDMLLRPKCLIIDEMDGIAANVASFLLQQDIHCPVFCLCNDFYVPSLRSLRRQCHHVYYFPPIRPQRLLSRLSEIVELEGLSVSKPALADLVQSSNGDVRCCLNTLQFLCRHTSLSGEERDPLQLMREMQGKDSKLGLWDTWRLFFERQERSKYIHLLRKEYTMDYGATVMAGNQHNLAGTEMTGRNGGSLHSTEDPAQPQGEEHVTLGFRVDPGYVYVSRVAQQCADTSILLDGLQEFYVQRLYADYSFKQTQHMADAFSFQDNLATRSYRDAASAVLIPFVEQYACTTAAVCFICCSSSRRAGAHIGFPRECAMLSQRMSESVNIARTFREGCHGETAAHMCSLDVISQEIAPLLLRSLLDLSLRVPAHSLASLSALNPQDQQLLLSSVARHAEYGITYARMSRARNESNEADDAVEEHWELTPPIHRLGCVLREAASSTPLARRATLAAPAPQTTASASLRPAASIMVLRVKEELKQLMVGEIRRFVIQRNAANTARNSTNTNQPPQAVREAMAASNAGHMRGREKRNKEEEEEEGEKTAPVKKAMKTSHTAASTPLGVPDVAFAPKPRPPAGKRDFFGRLIPEVSAKLSPSINCKKPTAAATANVTVQYIYHDGSTNAVRIPAVFEDF
ncbi:hypothetical protein MOQ_007730 [Trypanosoma cruzi marinkellei]|uniref:AAA+ ATPase domain-containing protein n=1 Tax=Trypanosoma cruzi marinkellei TaxID=85056 RepID=K2NHY8_TRYCR|nr:hypothetical protein MOQ_007730 [Trypanosoma cruzi marinkellei]